MKKILLISTFIFLSSCTFQREIKRSYTDAQVIDKHSELVSKWLSMKAAGQINSDELISLMHGQLIFNEMNKITKKPKK